MKTNKLITIIGLAIGGYFLFSSFKGAEKKEVEKMLPPVDVDAENEIKHYQPGNPGTPLNHDIPESANKYLVHHIMKINLQSMFSPDPVCRIMLKGAMLSDPIVAVGSTLQLNIMGMDNPLNPLYNKKTGKILGVHPVAIDSNDKFNRWIDVEIPFVGQINAGMQTCAESVSTATIY